MMKTSVKYLLFLFVLLLNGHSNPLSAQTYSEHPVNSPAENLIGTGAVYSSFGIVLYDQTTIVKAPASFAERHFKLGVAENEVEEYDELIPLKKFSEINYVFNAGKYGFFNDLKKCASVSQNSSYFSSYPTLYIVFRAFRI